MGTALMASNGTLINISCTANAIILKGNKAKAKGPSVANQSTYNW